MNLGLIIIICVSVFPVFEHNQAKSLVSHRQRERDTVFSGNAKMIPHPKKACKCTSFHKLGLDWDWEGD